MSWSLHMDKSAAERIVSDPAGPAVSALRDILARHAVMFVPDAATGATKGVSFNLRSTEGHILAHDEESAIIDELMLADTQGFIGGATGTPQPRLS
jgi:hypothetical protein